MNNSESKYMRNKLGLSFILIAIFAVYSVFYSRSRVGNQTLSGSSSLNVEILPGASQGKYVDGTYTGSVEDVYYGNVEVQVSILNGNISDVQFLQFPNSSGNSITKSNHSMPILRSEAIANQTGNVDIVSGATQTSKGFIRSMNNALAQAQK
jgi:uncharacterized protein with FMN-binding domain